MIDPKMPQPCTTIVYDETVDRQFDVFASGCGYLPADLPRASERAILKRRHKARIPHACYRARGKQPDIWELKLDGGCSVLYTDEPHAIVIRGYWWKREAELLDDEEGGRIYMENSWYID
jgi:hypothetical protein